MVGRGFRTLAALAAPALLCALSLAPSSGPAPLRLSARPASAVTEALPSGRLEFGVSSQPDGLGWMSSSGVPWKYRYQYLAGGVRTGHGWETWNSPAGAYAGLYMASSRQAGYIPVLTYYELLQSTTGTGSESDRDFGALNDPALMASYYANFKLLMEQSAAYSGPVVIHVEPDLWGYLQQRAAGAGPSALTAAVASSGAAELAALPNTTAGFAAALIRLRDLYAPNAVLAVHASMWATGVDVATNTSANVSGSAQGTATAAFLKATGPWDAVFQDIDDHDAGWWEAQGADNQWFTHWWDPTNQSYPNFNRYLEWSTALHSGTGLPQVVWQVPLGNQYYLTENNSCGHYQDNVAQYLIAHPAQLQAAGLVAVLFGAGNACQTANTDAAGDGVTNNNGRPTSDFGCQGCNTQTSTVSDDDGGYLRFAVAAYYATASLPPPAPQPQTYSGGLFHAVAPVRVLDTRTGLGHSGALGGGQKADLDLSAAVPAGATSVTLNVTATQPTAAGYITVYPGGAAAAPVASNLNFLPGQTVANLVDVALGQDKHVSLFNFAGSVDVVADLNGYTLAGGGAGFVGQAPQRLLDTRLGPGPLGPGQVLTLTALPPGATAVVLNVTATSPTAASYLTVWPAGTPRPVASNLNFVAGQTIQNRVAVQVGPAGVSIFNASGYTQVVADLGGYFAASPGASFTAVTPTRLLDTRSGSPLSAGETRSLAVTGGSAAVPAGARAVVLNVTPAGALSDSYLTVWPAGSARPVASDVNVSPLQGTPNLTVVAVGAAGSIEIFSSNGPQDVVVDLLGWYS